MAGARTQGRPRPGAETGAKVSPRFRARAGTDAAPGAGAGVWAGKSGVWVRIGFVDLIVSRFSVFNGICADLRTTDRVLFHSVCTYC